MDLFDSWPKILIIAIVVILLFGSAKLPIFARSLGKSMRILKTEVQGLNKDEDEAVTTTATVQSAPAQLQAPAFQAQAVPAAPDAQAQIDALSKQLADLQRSVAANETDSAQAQ